MGTSWEVDSNGVLKKPLVVGNGVGQFVQVPTLTTVQRNALVAVAGMVIYNSTTNQFEKYEAGAWGSMGSAQIFTVMSEPTGFPDRISTTISFTASSLTFTITPTGATFDLWIKGVKIIKTGAQSKVIANTEGLHYIYYDNAGVLQETTTFSSALLTDNAIVAIVYWSVASQEANYLGDERHGTIMDGMTHYQQHISRGTVFASGLALNSILNDQTGALDSHAQIGVDLGKILDEDVVIDEPVQTAPANIPVWYREGISGNWRLSTGTTRTWQISTAYLLGDRVSSGNFVYEVTVAGTSGLVAPAFPTTIGNTVVDNGVTWRCRFGKLFPVMNVNGASPQRLAYNQFTGGAWQQTDIGSNTNFMLMHIFASNDPRYPIVAVQGQAVYNTIANARTGALNEINSLQLGTFPLVECQPLATLIYSSSTAYGNNVRALIRSPTTGTYTDWRASKGFTAGGTSSSHSTLSGLLNDDHPQYGNIQDQEWIPEPEVQRTAQSTRAGQSTFEGSSYKIRSRTQFNRVIARLTATPSTPTDVKILIYQTVNGKPGNGTNIPQLVATCIQTGIVGGAQTLTITPSEGTVTILPGVIYLLFGVTLGSATFRVYGQQNYDLMNSNTPTNCHPVAFTTAISTATTPTTFNPLQTGDGGSTTETGTDVSLVHRFRKV